MQAASQDQDGVQKKKKKEDNARIWHNLKILIPRSYLGPIAHAQRVLDRIYIFFGNGCLTGTLSRAVARAAIITLVVWFHFRYFPLSCTSQDVVCTRTTCNGWPENHHFISGRYYRAPSTGRSSAFPSDLDPQVSGT